MARKILKNLKKSTDYKKLYSLPGGGTPGTPQSMCVMGSDNFIVAHNQNNSNKIGYLIRYTKTGRKKPTILTKNGCRHYNMSHANGCAYIAPLRLIAIKHPSKKVTLYDADTLKYSHSVDVTPTAQNIAYDRKNNVVVIRSGKKLYIYPYSKFNQKGSGKAKVVKLSNTFSGINQDIGTYNGVTYVIQTPNKSHSYLDLYNTFTGKYLGSYHMSDIPELESVDFFNGVMYGCGATNRAMYEFKISLPSASGSFSSTGSSSTQTIDKDEMIKKYGNEAKVYYALRSAGWTHKGTCAVMGNIHQESGFRTTAVSFDGYGSVGICQWTFGRKTKLKNFLKSNGYPLDSIEGQCKYLVKETAQSYKSVNRLLVNEVPESLNYICDYFCDHWEIPNPKYANKPTRRKYAQIYYARYSGAGIDGTSGLSIDFNTTTSKLSSSNNFEYIEEQKKEESSTEVLGNSLAESFKDAVNQLKLLDKSSAEVPSIESQLTKYNVFNTKPPKKNTFGGEVSGSNFPIYNTIVEAPFVELTVGGVTFGTFKHSKNLNSYPNYIQSLEVSKTNGTINQYKINLIHQISPGDNPNYISELLSKNGFEKIHISYGDSAAGCYFRDIEALLTNVNTSFNFTNNVIQYSLEATSLSYLTATTKLNFSAQTAKPSSVIMGLLKDKNSLLTDYFSGMSDLQKINQLGLIPTNDREVQINAVKNKNIVEYITYLVSLMKNENDEIANKSSYYLVVNDEVYEGLGNTFKIKEIVSDSKKINELVYEVDLGYPDDNMVFDFSVNTNYGWSAAIETSSKISNYIYDINSFGDINKIKANSLLKSGLTMSELQTDENTWKQLTRFPVSATLTIKGLMAPIMLLTYVKVNNYYFGNKRITSGMYIVTEQKDYISGNGCRTTLGLTRVASDVESITVDGRVRT